MLSRTVYFVPVGCFLLHTSLNDAVLTVDLVQCGGKMTKRGFLKKYLFLFTIHSSVGISSTGSVHRIKAGHDE